MANRLIGAGAVLAIGLTAAAAAAQTQADSSCESENFSYWAIQLGGVSDDDGFGRQLVQKGRDLLAYADRAAARGDAAACAKAVAALERVIGGDLASAKLPPGEEVAVGAQ